MTGVEGDFRSFVAARFAELHAVAAVTTGDSAAASRMTATALASLADRWAELTTVATPTAAARTSVLTAALTTTSGARPTGTTRDDGPDDEGCAARAALTEALRAAPATARAALAVAHFWDEPPALVAACADTDPATVRAQLASLRGTLARTHADARGRRPEELAWALPAAVADALEHEADATALDPVSLVDAARTRRTRRRRTHVGALAAAATLALAATTALAWPGPVPAGTVPTPPPDAPGWADVTSWSPRGPLAGDPAVTAIVSGRGGDPAARLLYAGTVGDTTVVLMTGTQLQTMPAGAPDPGPAPEPGMAEVSLQLWTAPARRGTAALTPAAIEGSDAAASSSDVVALSIDQDTAGAAAVVLVLTRPTITTAFAKTGARPDPDGSAQPVVQTLELAYGVATFTQTPGYPSQVVVGGFTGPPAGTVDDDDPLPARGIPEDLAAAQRGLLAAVTGYPTDTLRTPSALDAVVDVPNPDTAMLGTDPGPVHVTIATTLTPGGGWARTARVSTTNPEGGWRYLERLAAVPDEDHSHALLPVGDGRRPTFVALAPDAATAVLLTTAGQVRDTASIRDGMAVLTSPKDPTTTTFRLRLLAPDGHTVYDEVPPTGTEL